MKNNRKPEREERKRNQGTRVSLGFKTCRRQSQWSKVVVNIRRGVQTNNLSLVIVGRFKNN